MDKSGITRKDIISWGGNEVFNRALALCQSGEVLDVKYDGASRTVSGKILRSDGWGMPVSFMIESRSRIVPKCPCYTNSQLGQVCEHVAAIAIAQMVLEMEDESASESCSAKSAGQQSPREIAAPSGEAVAGPSHIVQVPLKPEIFAYLQGSRASLSLEIDVHYRQVEFPVCSLQAPDTVFFKDDDDPDIRYVRSVDEELAAIELAKSCRFKPTMEGGGGRLIIDNTADVMEFLGRGLPFLRRNGWHVDLAPRLLEIADAIPMVVPVVEVRDAQGGDFEVAYHFEAMGKDLSPALVQVAVNNKKGYIIKNDGSAVLIDCEAVEAMHRIFRDIATPAGNPDSPWYRIKRVHGPFVKSALESLECIDIEDDNAPVWRETARQINREGGAALQAVALGELDKVLRPYQKQGVYWMRYLESSGICGLLADEMGLGKTLQTLTWLSLPRCNAHGKLPSLVVCPTSLVRNWEAEIAKFTPWQRSLVISGPDRAQDFAKIAAADIVITSYALLQRDFEAAYATQRFGAIVLDEAQHIKNRETKNAKSVKMLQSETRLALTGTPVENSVADVWSIFDFLMPDYLGDYTLFKVEYEEPIANGGSDGAIAQLNLKRKLHPFILRRLKQFVAKDLPDKIQKVSYCPLDEDAQRKYVEAKRKTRESARDVIRQKGFSKSKFELLAMLMKLRQIASRGKLPSFMEQLEDAIAGGHKILVFSQFVGTLKLIAEEFGKRGIRHCYLDGSTKDRLEECNRFNRTPEIGVFLISLMAGGTGLNLTGADMVIHYDPWWNPAVEDQATDRAHRIGQKKNVYVLKMIACDTIEEKVLALQKKKRAVIAATVETTDQDVLNRLTAEDIADLLK